MKESQYIDRANAIEKAHKDIEEQRKPIIQFQAEKVKHFQPFPGTVLGDSG